MAKQSVGRGRFFVLEPVNDFAVALFLRAASRTAPPESATPLALIAPGVFRNGPATLVHDERDA